MSVELKPALRLSRDRRRFVWVAAAAFSTTAIILLIRGAELPLLGTVAKATNPFLVLAAIAALAAANIFHALRLRLMLAGAFQVSVRKSLMIALRYGLYVAILPARLGEVAYVVRLTHEIGISRGSAAALTIHQRLYDLMVIGGLVLVAAVSFANAFVAPVLLVALVVVSCGFVLLAAFRFDRVIAAFAHVAHWADRRTDGRFSWITPAVGGSGSWTAGMNTWRRSLGLLSLTSAEWALNVIALGLVIGSVGTRLPAWELLAVSGITFAASAIPVHTVGGIGTVESGLVGGLLLSGLPLALASAIALVNRALLLGVPVLLWAGALAIEKVREVAPR